jgi:hypothetical protein
MASLSHWDKKIQMARSGTPLRVFIKEICSNIPLVLYKYSKEVSRYPLGERIKNLSTMKEYEEIRSGFTKISLPVYDFTKNFFENYVYIYKDFPYQSRLADPMSQNSNYAEAVR